MTPYLPLEAPACGLDMANIDTDQLIPARFMKEPRAAGYGQFLFHDLRNTPSGEPVHDFPLTADRAGTCKILVARRNFGAGSSREAAVYALADYGIRCVIAPSFGDIFASNAVNNGVLPATVGEEDCERLFRYFDHPIRPLTVDLEALKIRTKQFSIGFDIRPGWKLRLLNGWDDIDLTRQQRGTIHAFRDRHFSRFPWIAEKQQAGKPDLPIRSSGDIT